MRATSISVLSATALTLSATFQLAAAGCTPPSATPTGLVFADRTCATGCLVSCPPSMVGVPTIATCGANNQWVNLPVCVPTNVQPSAKVNSTSTSSPPSTPANSTKNATNAPAPRPPAPVDNGGCNLPNITGLNTAACTRITRTSGTCLISCSTGYTGTAATAQCLSSGSWASLPTCTFGTGGFNGWTRAVPTSTKRVGTAGCTAYNPNNVNWVAAHDWLIAYFKQPGLIGPDQIPYKRVATLALRASFHDAGSNQGALGGQDGSHILSAAEQDWDANSFPFKFVPYVKAAVWPMVDTFGMSYADALALAGFTGAQFIGAPSRATLSFGRCDSNIENPNVLPASNLDYIGFAKYWASVGISIADAATLLGVHSAIDNENGGPPAQWSSILYQSQLKGSVTIVNMTEPEGAKAVKWTEGPWKFTTNDALMSSQMVAQTCNPQPSKCPFKAQYLNLIANFATNVNKWNNDFSGAFDRMTRIGAKFGPTTAAILIPQLGGGPAGPAGPPPPPPPPPGPPRRP